MAGSRKKFWIVGGLAAAVFVLGIAGAVKWTSGTAFCLSCHEMRVYQKEMAFSAHAKDADGKEIGCAQCHIPNANIVRMLAAKSWMGIRDVWVHNVHGGNNLNRREMQVVARRFTDDANCRACHEDLTLNAAKKEPISEFGKLAHANYLGQNGQARSGCVGCHVNLAHLPAFDARIPINQKFAARMQEGKL